MKIRKKILLITIQPPRMPGMGGEVRAYYMIRTAAEMGQVTLASLGGPNGDLPVQTDIAALCEEVIEPSRMATRKQETSKPSRAMSLLNTASVFLFPWRRRWSHFLTYFMQYCPAVETSNSKPQKWSGRLLAKLLRWEFDLLTRWFQVPPLTCFMFDQSYDRIEGALKGVLDRNDFDVLWVEHTLTWPFAADLIRSLPSPAPLIICSAHNVESLVYQRLSDLAATANERWYWRKQRDLLRAMEQNAYQRSSLVFQCSEKDEDLGRSMSPGSHFCVVGNGVNNEYFTPREGAIQSKRPTILFTAGFGYGPNQEALEFFLQKIYPLVKRQCPDCQFVFAGSQAQRMQDRLKITDSSVQCVSDPEDMRPCFENAWVFVVPLRAGGGTRLKILESMAMQRPIVSTRLGAEGIDCVEGTHLLLADEPQDFADQVVRLLSDSELRQALVEQASCLVREHYDWEILCEKARTQLSRLL